jgi:NADPH:quinone reductase-like Zn-dependent oxidoreductase
MKVIEIRDKFGVDFLALAERPEHVSGPGQLVLKMKAFSLNYRDLLLVNGVGRWKPSLPRTASVTMTILSPGIKWRFRSGA